MAGPVPDRGNPVVSTHSFIPVRTEGQVDPTRKALPAGKAPENGFGLAISK
jgi:hypothetical protein